MSNQENNQLNSEPNNFGLPGDYFQRSASSIFNKIEWQDEHKDFPKLLQYKNSQGFIVPVNYFKKHEHALELIGLPQLSAIKKNNPFGVPANYFEDAETTILAQHLTDHENELRTFETLSAVAKQNNFKTGKHYFQDNEAKLTAFLETDKKGRIIGLFPKKVSYAAAALLALALGFWIYSFYFKPVELQDCGTIACVDRIDLVKTKTLENLDNEDLYEIVNTKKLEEHLKSGAVKNNDNVKTDSSAKHDAIDDLPDGI